MSQNVFHGESSRNIIVVAFCLKGDIFFNEMEVDNHTQNLKSYLHLLYSPERTARARCWGTPALITPSG